MLEFFQSNYIAVILFLFLTLMALLIVILKIDLQRVGKSIAVIMIVLSLIGALLLMQESLFKAIAIKLFVVSLTLFGSFLIYKKMKLK